MAKKSKRLARRTRPARKEKDPGGLMLATWDDDRVARTQKGAGRGQTTAAADRSATREEREVKWWLDRIIQANKAYDDWAQEFRVKTLEQYYEGHHWFGLTEQEARQRYVVNLTFATVETQLPSLLFSKPRVMVEGKPDRKTIAASDVNNRATLIQNTIQTQVDDREISFGFETTLSLHDTYMRFGIVEVGYDADWIDNPNAGKPALDPDDDETELVGSDGKVVRQPDQVQEDERVYVKHIPAQTFRAYPGRNRMKDNDWVGYYQYFNVKDVKADPNFQNTADLKGTGKIVNSVETEESDSSEYDRDVNRVKQDDQIKVWKIWDLRKKEKIWIAEGGKRPLRRKPFKTLPLSAMKFYERKDSFYPIPPLWNWLSPQDEINETREMMKVHRRRAVRRYMRTPQVRKEEWEKLETGPDGTCIEVPDLSNAIKAIENAELGQLDIQGGLAASKDDFSQITGVGGEARGIPEADTATQANIINVRSQVRESRARQQVADWLSDICRLILLCIRDSFDMPLVIKQGVDPYAMSPSTLERTVTGWTQIETEDIAELDVDIKIDIASLSPVAEDIARQNWNVILGLLQNQNLLILLMTENDEAPHEPPPLLRKTLYLNGIKDEAEVREIFRVGQKAVKAMALLAMAAAAAKGQPPQSGMPGQFNPPPPSDGTALPGRAGGAPSGTPAQAPTMS